MTSIIKMSNHLKTVKARIQHFKYNFIHYRSRMKSSIFVDQQIGCNCFNTSSNARDNLFLYKKEPEDSHSQIRKAYKSIQSKHQQLDNKGNKKSLKKKRPNSQIQQEKIGFQDYHLSKVQQLEKKVDKKYDLDDKKSLKNMNKNNSTHINTNNANTYCSVPVKKEMNPKTNINFYQIQKFQPKQTQFLHQNKTVDMKHYSEYRQEMQRIKQQINIEDGIPIEGFEKLLNGKQDQTSKISLTLRSKPTLRDVHSSKRHVMKNFGRMAESDDDASDSPPSEIIGKGFDNYMFEVEGSKMEPTIITRSTNTYKLSQIPKIQKNNYPYNYGQTSVQFQNHMRNIKSFQNL